MRKFSGSGTRWRINTGKSLAALSDYLNEWGYESRIAWEQRRIGAYLNWPIVGYCIRRLLKKK